MPTLIGGSKCDCGNTDSVWIMVGCDCGRSICWSCAEYTDENEMICPSCKQIVDWSNHPLAKNDKYNNCENCICYKSKCLYRNEEGYCMRYDVLPQCGDERCVIKKCDSVKHSGIKKRPW